MAINKLALQRIANLRLQGKNGYEADLALLLSDDQDTIKKWSTPLTNQERQERNDAIFNHWLAGETTTELANKLYLTQQLVSEVIIYTKHFVRNNLCSSEQPPVYNVWNYTTCDPRFGQKHPGQIPEVKSLVDQATLFTQWLRKQKAGLEAQNAGAEMKLRAERKLGELLIEEGFGRHGGDRKSSVMMTLDNFGITDKAIMSHNVTLSPKLSELNISRMQANRWLASIFGPQRLPSPSLPKLESQVLYADPPWAFDNSGFDQSAAQKYPVLKPELIENYTDETGRQIHPN